MKQCFRPLAAFVWVGVLLCPTFLVHSQQPGFYLKGDLGGTLTSDLELKEYFGPVTPGSKVKLDPGARFGFAGGFQVTDWFAAEVETGIMASTIDSITEATRVDAAFSNVPFLVNAKFQWPCTCGFTPHIGGGVGFSATILEADRITLNDITIDGSAADTVFAYQAFGGLRYRINDHMGLSLEYRYFATESSNLQADFVSSGIDSDRIRFGGAKTHSLSIAFDYRF